MATKSSVDQLNSFLRGEMAAVETYRMAIESIDPKIAILAMTTRSSINVKACRFGRVRDCMVIL